MLMPDPQIAPLPYRHTQIGYPMLAGMALGTLTQVRGLFRDRRAGRPRWWWYVPGWLAFAALMLAFSRLTVQVDEKCVSAGFGGGLARRRFELHTIEAASVIKTPWLAGWGIRLTRQGWLYNAWGRGAVQLRFAGGRRFTIGTDEPEALLAAIARARAGLVTE
jgi:hypothetical protein